MLSSRSKKRVFTSGQPPTSSIVKSPAGPEESNSVSTPSTIGGFISAQEQIPTLLSLDQSLLLVWPQVVVLLALTVICFAAGYVLFMRQEVRA